MKDQYGRIIDYMRISITDRCNLRCRYCMPEGVELVPMKNILSYEEIEMVCQAAAKAGIRKFKITGGEPLVRLGCPELIGKIKKIPGVEQVTMTTNGVLLSKYLPELLENGLDAVNISLDTLDRERYQVITGRDELFRVLESVDQAVDAGIPVKINSVLQKGMNEDEFLTLARLTLEKKLDVRFIEMMPIGLGKKFETIYNEDILEELKKQYPGIQEDRQIHGNGPAVYVKLPVGEQPLKHQLMRLADQRQVSVIFTTGGTGFAERDVTPEATQAVCDRMAMGIADAIRQYSLSITGRAMLSRAVSGIRKKTLIVNLPGSPKAVKESLEYVLPHLGHGLGILRGTDGECGNS